MESISLLATACWCFLVVRLRWVNRGSNFRLATTGEELTVTLDPRFVIDFLKVLDADKTFSFEVKDAESAAVCKTDDGYGYVIMPLSRDR